MIIEQNKVVSLIYELRSSGSDGKVVESLNESNPLTFLFGTGSLLPKFEDNISGLKIGDSFDFELKCNEAYGDAISDAIIDIPKSVFMVDGQFDSEMIKIGNTIPMMDSEGNRLNGVVVNVALETVKMDFNHPLAGEDLHFKGKIVEIRAASEEEIAHGHLHGSHSCGGCGEHESNEGCGSCCS